MFLELIKSVIIFLSTIVLTESMLELFTFTTVIIFDRMVSQVQTVIVSAMKNDSAFRNINEPDKNTNHDVDMMFGTCIFQLFCERFASTGITSYFTRHVLTTRCFVVRLCHFRNALWNIGPIFEQLSFYMEVGCFLLRNRNLPVGPFTLLINIYVGALGWKLER